MFQSVLVLCIGNICRSPVAEGILKKYAEQYHLNLSISSAGVHAMLDQGAQPHSISVADEHNIDITSHQAKQVTIEMMHEHELILVADDTVRKIASQQYPFATGKIKRIGHFRHEDIQDPYLKAKSYFDIMYQHLDLCLQDWLRKVWQVSI